uniref:Uncharacterized protein n=1 Tax=Strongyloides stercoralis TaxID=6248 RepID=A0A0K0EPB0_STRER
MISKKNIFQVIGLTLFLTLPIFSLKCDNVYDYSLQGFEAKQPDNILDGCDGCGYLWSNVTDPYLFEGYMSSCWTLPKMIATKYAPEVNITYFQSYCALAESSNSSYCYDTYYINVDLDSGSEEVWITSLCCCYSDNCTREFLDPSIPLSGSSYGKHKNRRLIRDKFVLTKTKDSNFH